MTKRKFFKLRRELCRRIWLQQKGSLKGFGKSEKAMRGLAPDFEKARTFPGMENVRGYADVWNCEAFRVLRETVGM